MSTVAHRNSRVQVGNGVECETARPRRTLRHELSAEQYSDHDLDLNKDTYGTREMEQTPSRGTGSIKRQCSTSEDNIPTVLPLQLAMVQGPDRLPDSEGAQDVLRGKLRVLEADPGKVTTLLSELSANLLTINSEENALYVTFKTFEEIWKFSTYYKMGFLGQCMENLLLDQNFWLNSLDQENAGIEISIKEDTMNLMYKGFLMQEGSFYATCTSNQMFDSSTSGSDLYLEKGDIALFEPPFLGSGWTVLSLADGSRGTKSNPGLEPVIPFYEWFLKSCPEGAIVGKGKETHSFPYQFATGACVATEDYDGSAPDELSFEAGDRIAVVGLLVSCFQWFLGRRENNGDLGLVQTHLVKPTDSLCESTDIFLTTEDRLFFKMEQEKIKEETIDMLKRTSQSEVGTIYQLDLISDSPAISSETHPSEDGDVNAKTEVELKSKIVDYLHKLTISNGTATGTARSSDDVDMSSGKELESKDMPNFIVCSEKDGTSPDGHHSLLSFLGSPDFREELRSLYTSYPEFLMSCFHGHADEEELVAYLGVARETARKKRQLWAQSRICFLLGQMCASRSKFSQARVYYEEALSVPRDCFTDMHMLVALYANLALIYLTQKNVEKYFALSERLAALMMGMPDAISGTEDPDVLKFLLRKAILSRNKPAEARGCFLLAKLHLKLGKAVSAVPFLERLQILSSQLSGVCEGTRSHGYLLLGRLYSDVGLPYLAVSSAHQASLQTSTTLSDCLCAISLLLENALRLYGAAVPAQVAPYLTRAVSLARQGTELRLAHVHALCLSWLFHQHGLPDRAVGYMRAFLLDVGSESGMTQADATDALIWLAWLYICGGRPQVALDVLDAVLASLPEHCTTQQEGVVYNMRAIALGRTGNLRHAAESYRAAAEVCEEFEDRHNWAVALANLGLLCLRAKAKSLAEEHLVQAVELFSELEEEELDGHELSFITVLLELGQHYVSQGYHERGKIYYEWGLLLAIQSDHSESQLKATRHLCHLYAQVCPNEAQCIIYNEHQLALVHHMGDRSVEADILETISQLYLSLGTEKAYKSALEHTKQSLGIFIDLGMKKKEAQAWLQAGKIYHMLRQTELVELYVQVAQDVGLSTGDTLFILELLEAAGDIFFNSTAERDKAVCFYRDRALPIAVKTGSVCSQLRLCNKLAQLLLQMRVCEEAVEFAQTALDLSVSLGDDLNERVAFHRLATLYHCLGQFEMAEHHYLKALSLCPAPLQYDEETLYYVRVYQTLGDIIFYDLKDPFDAAGYYHLALAAAMDLGNKKAQLNLCTRLATIYHNFLMDRELSLFFYQRARAFASDLNVRRINLAPDQNFQSTAQYRMDPQPLSVAVSTG
ncbi:SH3 domain and tetratricopeptide repeat-containing protein 1 isoform X2 [Clupea harengus]|uniref:SH3 domain and tetratricopeptide repeat-containing protein 1 isoform X2 n=1 Tax=Clupea harengus TaxID=7950 RepID=A0A6P8H1J9_CLUHA|nr:SH3 domain and tetratricopeptide repeat-containing protein 1 isoform X2 [Clupea harengus]